MNAATLYRVHYIGPTDTRGGRFAIVNMSTAHRTLVDYDYAADNPRKAAVQSVAPHLTLQYAGEDSKHAFYIASIPND